MRSTNVSLSRNEKQKIQTSQKRGSIQTNNVNFSNNAKLLKNSRASNNNVPMKFFQPSTARSLKQSHMLDTNNMSTFDSNQKSTMVIPN